MEDSESTADGESPEGAIPAFARDNLPVRDWWGEPDRTLCFLVGVINRLEFEVPIRVFTPAGILSGSLVSAHHYFGLLASDLGKSASSDEEGSVMSALASMFSDMSSSFERSDGESGADDYDVRHIHLTDANLFVPGSEPLLIGLWRGHLSALSGWSFGSYELS